MKIEIFECINGNPIAIDTKKYRYFISKGQIQKIPIYLIDDVYVTKNHHFEKLQRDSRIKILKFNRFWKGFVYYSFDVYEEIDMLLNMINLLEEDLECVHMYLDDIGAPRKDADGEEYSIVGRIKNNKN